MAVDISSLTQLINTFKQETREETVTVEVLGSLLQKIVDILGTTALRKILDSPEPVDIRLWTRSGEIQHWNRSISLKYDFYKGTRRMKLLDSNQIRQLRDVCVFEVNGVEVYM